MAIPTYDPTNVFARILRGELSCKKIYEDEFALSFHDISPQAPVHALVIPKGAYVNRDDFAARGTDAELAGFQRAVSKVIGLLGVAETGYRIIINCGANGGQEVPHHHVHIISGRALGPMLVRPAS